MYSSVEQHSANVVALTVSGLPLHLFPVIWLIMLFHVHTFNLSVLYVGLGEAVVLGDTNMVSFQMTVEADLGTTDLLTVWKLAPS